jgi:hypothetical protein
MQKSIIKKSTQFAAAAVVAPPNTSQLIPALTQALEFWKAQFGRVVDVDWFEFIAKFAAFVLKAGGQRIDEYQTAFLHDLIDKNYS